MRRLIILCALLTACCHPLPAPAPDRNASCVDACTNLTRLSCAGMEGSPGVDDVYGTSDDVACARACSDLEAEGVVSMHADCVAAATSCQEAEACAN